MHNMEINNKQSKLQGLIFQLNSRDVVEMFFHTGQISKIQFKLSF